MDVIRLTNLYKNFPRFDQGAVQTGNHPVLTNFSLTLDRSKITVLIGRSGCGKTTLLHILAGLCSVDRGSIDPVDLSRRSGVVFQDHRLLPWATVEANLMLALHVRKDLSKQAKRDRVINVLGSLGLEKTLNSFPAELSGGMAQRVALGRALLLEPELFLLDEPFAALDAITRAEMQNLLLDLHISTPTTTLFVTHDLDEASLIADRILVMDQGRICSDIAVDLPHPRHSQDGTLRALKNRIEAALNNGTLKAPFIDTPLRSNQEQPYV